MYNPAMTSRKRSAWVWIVGTLLAVVLYVLSCGPVAWLLLRTNNVAYFPTYNAIYLPLILACEHSPAINDASHWYLEYWTSVSLAVRGK